MKRFQKHFGTFSYLSVDFPDWKKILSGHFHMCEDFGLWNLSATNWVGQSRTDYSTRNGYRLLATGIMRVFIRFLSTYTDKSVNTGFDLRMTLRVRHQTCI